MPGIIKQSLEDFYTRLKRGPLKQIHTRIPRPVYATLLETVFEDLPKLGFWNDEMVLDHLGGPKANHLYFLREKRAIIQTKGEKAIWS